jgi:hypothetical protein
VRRLELLAQQPMATGPDGTRTYAVPTRRATPSTRRLGKASTFLAARWRSHPGCPPHQPVRPSSVGVRPIW